MLVICPASLKLLQRGHRANAVESSPQAERRDGHHLASTGPPRERGGEREVTSRVVASGRASTGPPRERGGEHVIVESDDLERACFNGATARTRWRDACTGSHTPKPHGFNGATARTRWRAAMRTLQQGQIVELQRGHRANAVESPLVTQRKVETYELQRGHRANAVERCLLGFQLPQYCLASTGPPRERGGELLVGPS